MTSHDTLRQQLETLADRARAFLARWALQRDVRLVARNALTWTLAVAAPLAALQLVFRFTLGRALAWPIWMWIVALVAGPILVALGQIAWLGTRRRFDRRAGLALYDTELSAGERLVTADQFLTTKPLTSTDMDAFKRAAIDDASEHAARAMTTTLTPRPLPAWSTSRQSQMFALAAVVMIAVAAWLGRLAPVAMNPLATEASLGTTPESVPAKVASTLLKALSPRPRPLTRTTPDPQQGNDPQSAAGTSPKSMKTDQDAEGQAHAGGQSNSKSSSRAMSSSGTPSNQQTPSEAVEDDPPQDQKVNPANPPKKSDGKKPEPQSTSATSGQGQSRSSTSDTNKIPATDQPDRAGVNKDDGKDEAGVQDEVEEEKTAGVERPTLRKNKPPIDRNLSPRPTGDQPNPNANGRSGPGGLKKTRGVPAMILGIPTPDRIQGMNHPGRSKVTQENSTPKEEPQAALAAEARAARDAAFGRVMHPGLVPWMQYLIEAYFTRK